MVSTSRNNALYGLFSFSFLRPDKRLIFVKYFLAVLVWSRRVPTAMGLSPPRPFDESRENSVDIPQLVGVTRIVDVRLDDRGVET